MPKIFEYFGFVFYFFSNEHEPIHVHASIGDRETVFELILNNGQVVEVRKREKRGSDPLTAKEQKTAEKFVKKYAKSIVNKWIKFFVLKQKVRNTNIKEKI
jgi:hypothetical protein